MSPDAMSKANAQFLDRIASARATPVARAPVVRAVISQVSARQAAFARTTERLELARRAISIGCDKDGVMQCFGLSETAFGQLAGQVRSGS